VKILYVISSVDPRGGGPIEGVFKSAQVWTSHGHEVHIASLDSPDAEWVGSSPVKTIALGTPRRSQSRLRKLLPWLRYGYAPRFTRWLRAHAADFDVIIVNGLWNYVSFGTWHALRRLNLPYFVFTHGMLDPWFNKAYPVKYLLKASFWKIFEHKVLRDARGVLFTCEEERRLARQSFVPYSACEYVVGYGTTDISGDPTGQLATFFSAVPKVRGRRFMLFLSRIDKKKGIDLLLGAFARHADTFPDLDLVIAGPDLAGLQASLIDLSSRLGIAARVHWPGMLTGSAKWGAFRAAAFFVLPSHQENFGVVVAEAMALSRPVLITNKVNIWREVEADGAGIIVDDNAEAIAAGLQEMCSLSSSLLDEIGHKGRSGFLNRYNLEDNAMQFLSLLQRLSDDTHAILPLPGKTG
jgi:glycosyltransferase involved in cell wall biosynthesis